MLPAHNSSIFSFLYRVPQSSTITDTIFFPLQAIENSSQKLLHMSMIDTIILTRVLESDWLLTRLLIPGNAIPLG